MTVVATAQTFPLFESWLSGNVPTEDDSRIATLRTELAALKLPTGGLKSEMYARAVEAFKKWKTSREEELAAAAAKKSPDELAAAAAAAANEAAQKELDAQVEKSALKKKLADLLQEMMPDVFLNGSDVVISAIEEAIEKQKKETPPANETTPATTSRHADPWLAAAEGFCGVKYPASHVLAFSERRNLLDPFAWPGLIVRTACARTLRTSSGLRSVEAEELWQLWRQVCGATETECASLLKCFEEVALCVSSHGANPVGTFFVQHHSRFVEAQKVTKEVEAKLIRKTDPLVARQVCVRGDIAMLPLSYGSSEVARTAKITLAGNNNNNNRDRNDFNKRFRKDDGHADETPAERVCKYCKNHVSKDTSFFKHFKTCPKAKEGRSNK